MHDLTARRPSQVYYNPFLECSLKMNCWLEWVKLLDLYYSCLVRTVGQRYAIRTPELQRMIIVAVNLDVN